MSMGDSRTSVDGALLGCGDFQLTFAQPPYAVFAFGSVVNGFSRKESDLDIAVISASSEHEVIGKSTYPVSTHFMTLEQLAFSERANVFLTEHVVPLHNTQAVEQLSYHHKREVVLYAAAHHGENLFYATTPFYRHYILEWGIKRPERHNHLKRMLRSAETHDILRAAYYPVCERLCEEGLIVRDGRFFKTAPNVQLQYEERFKWYDPIKAGHILHPFSVVRNLVRYHWRSEAPIVDRILHSSSNEVDTMHAKTARKALGSARRKILNAPYF